MSNIKINSITRLLSQIKFKGINLDLPRQITIFGSILGIISLFIPWIIDSQSNNSYNSFYSMTGNVGYMLMPFFLASIYVCISTSHKEKLKLYSNLSFKNHYIIILSGFFILLSSIISLNFINGLSAFFEYMYYGKGVTLSMTSGVLFLIGGFILKKNYNQKHSEIILNKLILDREQKKEETIKNNMKLPF